MISYFNAQLKAVDCAMGVVDLAHCLPHIRGTICNDNVASFHLKPKLSADLIKPIDDMDSSMSLHKVSSGQDEVMLHKVLVQPMS